jgi:hypothetical protein
MTQSKTIKQLRVHLAKTSPGEINRDVIEDLLTAAWDDFDGSDGGGMSSAKLIGRIESLVWDPPLLTFTVERHGPTVLGSRSAPLQGWVINLRTATANHGSAGYRRVGPINPRLNVEPIAEEIFSLILEHSSDDRLKWRPDGTVSVQIGKVIPADALPKRTLDGRRKRFRDELERKIADAGGRKIEPNHYVPPKS